MWTGTSQTSEQRMWRTTINPGQGTNTDILDKRNFTEYLELKAFFVTNLFMSNLFRFD